MLSTVADAENVAYAELYVSFIVILHSVHYEKVYPIASSFLRENWKQLHSRQFPLTTRIYSPVLLMLASQRIESVMDFSGESSFDDDLPTKRGAAPTLIELFILSWVSGKSLTFHSLLTFLLKRKTSCCQPFTDIWIFYQLNWFEFTLSIA